MSKKKLVFRPIRVKVIPRKNLCRLFSLVSGLTYSRWFEKRMSKVAYRERGVHPLRSMDRDERRPAGWKIALNLPN